MACPRQSAAEGTQRQADDLVVRGVDDKDDLNVVLDAGWITKDVLC